MINRLTYLMHVDWRWPKQRPHWLAEALAERLAVHVLYKPSVRRWMLVANPSDVYRRAMWTTIFSERVHASPLVALARAELRIRDSNSNDRAIWLSWPNQLEIARGTRGPIIYDCMDLAQQFSGPAVWRQRVARNERELITRADLLLAPSDRVADYLSSMNPSGNVAVVHNGYSPSMVWPPAGLPHNGIHLGYFGTIADWFDFDAVLAVLDAIPEARVTLIGPRMGVAIPAHDRVRWLGPRPHADLPALCRDVDIFFMPFRITPITEVVDPVKLYEYVASGRPAIAPRYDAVERFQPYVNLYSGVDELVALVRRFSGGVEDGASSLASRQQFLEASTWSARAKQILAAMSTL